MIKFIKLIFISFSVLLSFNNSISGTNFIEQVNKAYDKYVIVDDETIMVGDYTLVFGSYNNKYYISVYLLNNGTQNNHQIKVLINDIELTTFVYDSGVVLGYGLEVKSTDKFKVYVSDKNTDTLIDTYDVQNLIDELIKNPSKGLSTGEFPKNKRELDLIKTIKIYIYLFIALSVGFIVVLIILYRLRAGRFNSNFKEQEENLFKKNIEDEEIIDASFEVEQVNKQEIMDRLFEEYRHGDITEEELNEKLKKLWWNND